MNASSSSSSYEFLTGESQNSSQQVNYCVLPTEHQHPKSPSYLAGLLGDLLSHEDLEHAASIMATLKPANNKLDPYIDAVQVRSRVNNKRGGRVPAAAALAPGRDHEPKPSYYSKTVHVETHDEDSHSWDLHDDDHDDEHDHDDHYDHHDDDDHYGHHGKKKKKSRKGKHGGHKKKKRIYVKKQKPRKKKKYHMKKKGHYHKDDHHYGLHQHHGHYEHGGKKGKQVVYAYMHHDHKKAGKHLAHHHSGHLSVANLLGYTLLCVNYLMVLQQPTYDKHSGHYYTKYQPHSHHHHDHYGSKEVVKLKTGGPVILAHCGELPEPRGLVLHASSSQVANSSSSKAPTRLLAAHSETVGSQPMAAASPPAYYYTLSPYSGPSARSGNLLESYLGGWLRPGSSPSSLALRDGDEDDHLSRVLSPRQRLRWQSNQLVQEEAPLVVARRDNLAALRRRPVEIGMRVAARRRYGGGPRRAVRLRDMERANLSLEAPSVEQMQADAPARLSPGNNLPLVDLPEFALAGDSIELTCNHKMAPDRLYSVKWFKDSLEFYRFIPANGAGRSKSQLYLPDVRLDLARSNSESVYLRNITHRSGGQYRCEAVSEGPNFETLSGERRMQVYSLPESGPQLRLLEGQEAGPLVRCTSARSSPAAQLVVTVDGRPVAGERVVENNTDSYSDGFESSALAFRLRLADFALEPAASGQLERAGSAAPGRQPKVGAKADGQPANNRTEKGSPNGLVQFDEQRPARRRRPEQRARKQKAELADEQPIPAGHPTSGRPPARLAARSAPAHSAKSQPARANEANDDGATNQRTPGRLDAAEQQQQQLTSYSNYIRIKCASLVPAVGYEMTSELSVPLGLLVAPGRRPAAAADQVEPDEARGQAAGSLQAPRNVLIDRLAQASLDTPTLGANSTASSGQQRQKQPRRRPPVRLTRPAAPPATQGSSSAARGPSLCWLVALVASLTIQTLLATKLHANS